MGVLVYGFLLYLTSFLKEPKLVFCPEFELVLSLSKSEPVNRPGSGYRHAYR